MQNQSIIQTRSQKLKSEAGKLKIDHNYINTSMEDKWLHDIHLNAYFKSLSSNVSKTRSDILLIGPSSSQLFKCGSSYQVLETATYLSLDSFNYIFFCINDSNESKNYTPNGCHWSLLFLNRLKETFYHIDSVKGLNKKQANTLAQNVAPDCQIVEIDTLQQSDSFECGLHVIVNTHILLNKLNVRNLDNFDQCINDNEKINKNSSQICHTKTDYINSSIPLSEEEKPSFVTIKRSKKNNTLKNDKKKCIDNEFKIQCSNSFEVLENSNTTHKEPSINSNIANTTISNTKGKNDNKKVNNNNNLRSPVYKHQSTISYGNTFRNSINSSIPQNENPKPPSVNKRPKLKLITDSHGRHLSNILNETLNERYDVSSFLKPNGKISHILDSVATEAKNMDKEDFLLIICGTNDITNNCCDLVKLKYNIQEKLKHIINTNVLLSSVPYRFDFPNINWTIKRFNDKLETLANCLENVQVLQISEYLNRTLYTRHGLHLNSFGKQIYSSYIKETIDSINSKCENFIPVIINNRTHFLDKMYSSRIKLKY